MAKRKRDSTAAAAEASSQPLTKRQKRKEKPQANALKRKAKEPVPAAPAASKRRKLQGPAGPILHPPTKRPALGGTIKRLPRKRISSLAGVDGSTRPGITRNGAKVSKGQGSGGFALGASDKEEELWVTAKTPFSFYLKTGLAAFIDKG
jgi:hypothetical protein